MSINPGPTPERPDDDPFLWLEEIEDAKAVAWVEEQNATTLARFGGDVWQADTDRLAAYLDRPDGIPYVSRRGENLYNFWQDADHARGLWRRTTLESFRTGDPKWDVLIDVDALAADEDTDWIWSSATTLPGTHDRAIVRLSRGGSDAVEIREFDLSSRRFVDDGFRLPEAKSGCVWLDRDTLLLISAHGDGMATSSGYSRTVRLWTRNDTPDGLPVLFEVPDHYMVGHAYVDRHASEERVVYCGMPGFFETEVWLGDRSGAHQKLDLPEDIDCDVHGAWLLVRRRSDWEIGGQVHPAGSLLAAPLQDFLDGDRDFELLFKPDERRVLRNWSWVGEVLVLSILDHLNPVFERLDPNASERWNREAMAGLPEIGVASVARIDREATESDGTLVANVEDPLTPPSLLIGRTGQAWEELKGAPEAFSPDGLTVTRHEAVSVDGERIPYVQIGPGGAPDGNAPVHMTGYGGFEISLLPRYRPSIGMLWLAMGGTSVLANIRGGGEFGPRWHEAGRREGKRLSHDDFAAVAADLVARGVTQPHRIAAEGGSNGGILITNMLVRYPERFGALFCTIPLIDMRRYSKLLAGASWIAEYGDPDVEEDWEFLKTYSAYHTAKPHGDDANYPPILIATTRRDDRVHPGHARKMTARLQALGHECFFYEPAAGGHGYGKDNREAAAFTALGLSFLRERIGWT